MSKAEPPSADWVGDAQLRLPPGIGLSFQRYALPDPSVIDRAPTSLGALPVGLSRDGDLLLPVAAGECFWIGLSLGGSPPLAVSLALEREHGELIDVLGGAQWNASTAALAQLPGTTVVDGIRRADGGFDPLLRDDGIGRLPRGRRLHFGIHRVGDRAAARTVTLELVDYPTFATRTGMPAPEPLDPDAGYKGWLLP